MARLGLKRVADVLDYERDIKGKRLIRLYAGVGAGKNYWINELAKNNPDLRILLITSRINIVNAQARKMGAATFLDLEKMVDNDDWGTAPDETRKIICTNARIEKFFKHRYKNDVPKTHLWNKFDLIVLDEAHSLTADSTFAESSFYVERFLKETYRRNKNCDIICMSGTQDPINWLFGSEHNEKLVTPIDCNNEGCIHLEPDTVSLVSKSIVADKMYDFWLNGERLIYFANTTDSMSTLVKELIQKGVPIEEIAINYSDDETKAKERKAKFPEELLERMDEVNQYLVDNEKLHPDIKIFISTSRNKEGISIEDDDIKRMICESHNKHELIQMAGRVRGNSRTGNGLENLAIVYNAKQHQSGYVEFDEFLNRQCLATVNETVEKYKGICKESGKIFDLKQVIETVTNSFSYIQYDYISEKFMLYPGKIYGAKQHKHWLWQFQRIIDNYDTFIQNRSGAEIFYQGWFPHSKCYAHIVDEEEIKKEKEEERRIRARAYMHKALIHGTGKENSYTEEEKDEILNGLRMFYAFTTQPNIGLKKAGFEIKRLSTKKELDSYKKWYFLDLEQ